MTETYTVQLPDGQVVTKQLPSGLSDEQIRAAFGLPESPVQRLTNALHGNLQAPPDTLQSRGTDTIRNALAALGVDERYGQHVANKAFGFLNDLTPVGDAVSADDARMAWNEGRYPAAAGNALLAALGAIPGLGDAAAGTAKAIIAPLFHGSPHKFDKFSLDKLGTGEGSQVRGRGLYFSSEPEVANQYVPPAVWDKPNDRYERRGALYEAALDTEPTELLDWDAPLSSTEGGQRLAEILKNYGFGDMASEQGAVAYKQAQAHGARQFGDPLRLFREAGIPATTHLDNGLSGSRFNDVRNYVVFDDSIIDILNRR